MKVGILRGSIREGRVGEAISTWVLDAARAHGGADFELIDLRFFDLPLYDAARIPTIANKRYDNPVIQAWSSAIDSCDGFIIVSPEYNHSVPGALKNAIDHLAGEWVGKPVAFVGYGADGALNAIDHLRQIFTTFEAMILDAQLSVNLVTDMDTKGFAPNQRRSAELNELLHSFITGMAETPAHHRRWRIGRVHGHSRICHAHECSQCHPRCAARPQTLSHLMPVA